MMKNHIHILMEPQVYPLEQCVHSFSFRYAQYFNQHYKREGHVFQGRYKSIPIDDDLYFKRVVRYIHLNPLHAGIVSTPQEYVWSSYGAYLGVKEFPWLYKDKVQC